MPRPQAVCRRSSVTRASQSKARLQHVTIRRGSWRSHVHRTHTAQRVQPFKLQTRNVGGRGALPSRSLGGSRGPFSHVREWPPCPASPRCGDLIAALRAAPFTAITRNGTLPQPPHPRSDTAARPWRKTSHSPRRIRRSSADATLSRLRFRHSPASRSS